MSIHKVFCTLFRRDIYLQRPISQLENAPIDWRGFSKGTGGVEGQNYGMTLISIRRLG